MEGINNATWRQIVINFYQKNQAKRKPYTIEYFRKLNVSRQQVYRAIKRYESGISHKQQLGAGRPRILTRPQERKVKKTNGWPTADQYCAISDQLLWLESRLLVIFYC